MPRSTSTACLSSYQLHRKSPFLRPPAYLAHQNSLAWRIHRLPRCRYFAACLNNVFWGQIPLKTLQKTIILSQKQNTQEPSLIWQQPRLTVPISFRLSPAAFATVTPAFMGQLGCYQNDAFCTTGLFYSKREMPSNSMATVEQRNVSHTFALILIVVQSGNS
jgi:hypothetical protein